MNLVAFRMFSIIPRVWNSLLMETFIMPRNEPSLYWWYYVIKSINQSIKYFNTTKKATDRDHIRRRKKTKNMAKTRTTHTIKVQELNIKYLQENWRLIFTQCGISEELKMKNIN